MARRWIDPKKRVQAAIRIPRTRRRTVVQGGGNRYLRIFRLHQRAGIERGEKAPRLPCVRHPVHPSPSTRRNDGFCRRRLCGLLCLWEASSAATAKNRTSRDQRIVSLRETNIRACVDLDHLAPGAEDVT